MKKTPSSVRALVSGSDRRGTDADASGHVIMKCENIEPSYVYLAPTLSGEEVKLGSSDVVYSRLNHIGVNFDLRSVVAIELNSRKAAYNLEFALKKYFSSYRRVYRGRGSCNSGHAEWFDSCILDSVGLALGNLKLGHETKMITDFWGYCMRDAIDPSGSVLPIKEVTGRKIIRRDRGKSIELREALKDIFGVSLECTVGRSPGGVGNTSIVLKTISSNRAVLEYFSNRLVEIKRKSFCGSIKRSIIRNVFIANHNVYLEFGFPLDGPERFTCESQKAVEEIFSEPIKFIRSMSGFNVLSSSRVRIDFMKLNGKL